MFSHSEDETKKSHEQENNEERQEDSVVDQKAEPNRGQDRQQRGKSETAERGKHRADYADFVGVFSPKILCHICFRFVRTASAARTLR